MRLLNKVPKSFRLSTFSPMKSDTNLLERSSPRVKFQEEKHELEPIQDLVNF